MAEALGRNPDDLSEELSVWDMQRWEAYFSLKEKELTKIDYYFARLTYLVFSALSGKSKDLKDFLAYQESVPEEPQSKLRNLAAQMHAIAAAHNASCAVTKG